MNDGAPTVQILVNGEPADAAQGTLLPELLNDLGLPPAGIMIERNGEALLRSEWPEVRVAAGDRYEILRVVAGG